MPFSAYQTFLFHLLSQLFSVMIHVFFVWLDYGQPATKIIHCLIITDNGWKKLILLHYPCHENILSTRVHKSSSEIYLSVANSILFDRGDTNFFIIEHR